MRESYCAGAASDFLTCDAQVRACARPVSQKRLIERLWEQSRHSMHFDSPLQVCEDYFRIPAEFPDNLPARPARRRERLRVRHDSDGVESAFAFGDGLENRDAFGAQRQAVGE